VDAVEPFVDEGCFRVGDGAGDGVGLVDELPPALGDVVGALSCC
jgi:hypothetical protein